MRETGLMFPNVELVAWLANIAKHNVGNPQFELINQISPKRLSNRLRSLAATDTVGLRPCLLDRKGSRVSVGRVYRLWRLWLNDGSRVCLRPPHKAHVWSCDPVRGRPHRGKAFRMLCIIDEFTRECLAVRIQRRLNSRNVLEELGKLFARRGTT